MILEVAQMEQYNNWEDFPDTVPYWVKRIVLANNRNLKRTNAQTEEQLRELYSKQSQKLYDLLLDIFNKIQRDTESEDGKIYTNDLYRTNNYHKIIEYFNKCAKAIGGEQLEITDRALLKTYEYAQSVVESYTPKSVIPFQFTVPEQINAEQAINQVWCLDGKEFSDRIWQSKTALVKDLAGTLADFTARGEAPYAIARGITERLKVDLYSAYRIARTETAHAQIKGQTDKYKAMGFTQGKWFATDGCAECQALDGKVFPLEQIQSMIPKHPNCECSFLLEVGE